jgi:hypothetical protein
MTNVVSLAEFRQKKCYPCVLPESERKELIECGYNPDDPADVEAYWNDVFEALI